MEKIKSFIDLIAWKKGHQLVMEPLKNAVFVIPLKKGIQDLRQKLNYKRGIY